jgi:hypothetical protein
MKHLLTLLAALVLVCAAPAQAPVGGYTGEQLDQLLAPIALYPDPLVAVILPASTAPADIALAAQYLTSGGAPAGIDAQGWDPSVKSLAHYPSVLEWMGSNPDWTAALGAAFAMQPADVLKSVQQLRAKARAAGTLVDTPQQTVVSEGDEIRIVPAQDNTIYVPQYDPEAVYDDTGGDAGPYVTFGIGYPVGAWLGFECDWDDFGIWFGPWHPGWDYRRDWRNSGWGGSRWHPDARRGHDLVRSAYRPGAGVPHPGMIAGARAAVRAGAQRPQVQVQQSGPDYRGRGESAAPRPSTPAPSSPLFGGYSRGTQTRDFSNRGRTSRQAPVKAAPARSSNAGARASAPAPAGRERH